MKFRLMKTIIAAILFLALPLAASENPLTVAVFDFDSKDEAVRDLGPKVSTLLNASLSANPNIITVERAELGKAVGEQELGLAGTVSADTAAKVGHLTGAKVIITGRVFNIDKERMIVAKIIGTETSRVFGELSKASVGSSLGDQAASLAEKVARTISTKGDLLVAHVESREQRIEKLRKRIKGDKLPVISVAIPETHFGAAVRDPAAQTELLLILQECGFIIADERSREKADFEISGEAFSALGARKGNLVSCKARVEIKVHDVSARKLLLVDRQTSVAVDIAEQTAGKTALQNAAFDLAGRIVPQLARR